MKTAIILLAVLITGCSNIERVYGDPIELAKKDCAKIGYYGQAYVQCVDRTVQQIRAQRSAERAAANSAPVIRQSIEYPQWQPIEQPALRSNRGVTCTPRLGGRIDCAPN
jgi:hypothetical protein